MNACVLIFVFSAANSDVYIASRTLYGLATVGNAPRIFAKTDSRGVPIYALGLSSTFCLLAYMNVRSSSQQVFIYFVNLVTIFGILTWISILLAHIFFIRARRAQGVPDTALAYVAPLGIWGSIGALIFSCLIAFFKGFNYFVPSANHGTMDWRNIITSYIGIPLYIIMIFGYKAVMKSKRVNAHEADLFSGKQRIDDEEAEFIANERAKNDGSEKSRWERIYEKTIGYVF
jgi:amino acid transporter